MSKITDRLIEESAKLVPEIYEDGLKASVQEAGGVISTLFGLVNHVLLYKPKTWVTMYKLKAIKFEEDFKKRLDSIPEKNIGDPAINVVGPLLDSLKYNLDEDKIREMYLNLLIKSIDNRESHKVHPLFVFVVSQMNYNDAIVFKYLYSNYKNAYIKSGKVNITVSGTDQFYSDALPEWIIEDNIENISIFDVSETVVRLQNFGLLTLMYDRTAGSSNLSKLYSKQEVQGQLAKYKLVDSKVEVKGTDCIIHINDFGKKFANVVF